jgi:hypothetical protein
MPDGSAGVGITVAGWLICILSSGLASVVTLAFSELVVPTPLSGGAAFWNFGAAQVGRVHWTPVNDFSENPVLDHRLHGFPERSSARSLSFMAPVLALGPSLTPRPLVRIPGGRLGSLCSRLTLGPSNYSGGESIQFGLLSSRFERRSAGRA